MMPATPSHPAVDMGQVGEDLCMLAPRPDDNELGIRWEIWLVSLTMRRRHDALAAKQTLLWGDECQSSDCRREITCVLEEGGSFLG